MGCCPPRRRKSRCPSRCRRRRRSSSCCRKGKITTNPFLNFLRCFRQRHCGWPASKVAIEGARAWCKLTKKQRRRFYQLARKKRGCTRGPLIIPTPCCKRPRRRSCPRRRRRSCPRRRRRRPSCPRRRKRSCPRRRRRNPCNSCPRE